MLVWPPWEIGVNTVAWALTTAVALAVLVDQLGPTPREVAAVERQAQAEATRPREVA